MVRERVAVFCFILNRFSSNGKRKANFVVHIVVLIDGDAGGIVHEKIFLKIRIKSSRDSRLLHVE